MEDVEDGSLASFADFLQDLDKMVDGAVDVAKEVIDKEATAWKDRVAQYLQAKHGGGTGGLLQSMRLVPAKRKGSYHGHRLEFDGYDPYGRPYQAIANTLNVGTVQGNRIVPPSHFIDNVAPPLRQLNNKIMEAVDDYVAEQDT